MKKEIIYTFTTIILILIAPNLQAQQPDNPPNKQQSEQVKPANNQPPIASEEDDYTAENSGKTKPIPNPSTNQDSLMNQLPAKDSPVKDSSVKPSPVNQSTDKDSTMNQATVDQATVDQPAAKQSSAPPKTSKPATSTINQPIQKPTSKPSNPSNKKSVPPQASKPTTPPTSKAAQPLKITLDIPPTIEVRETFEIMSQGKQPGLTVTIPSGKLNEVIKNWKAYLKIFKGKTKSKKEEMFTNDAFIENISKNPVDIYSRFEAYNGGVFLKVFFDLGDHFLAYQTHREKFKYAKNIVREFAVTESVKAYTRQLGVAESQLLALQTEREELQMKAAFTKKRIAEYQAVIKKAENALGQNQQYQKQKNEETRQQIKIIEQVKANLKGILKKQ